MKTRFNTYDIVCVVAELQKCIGMRVNNIYDINTKAYLIRLQRSEEKQVILLESGNRIHLTNFEWPKNIAPSGFSMKLRKHLRNKRLESLTQLGTDRIVDLQFGTGEAAYHIILELYDRGNIIITDYTFTILNVLRPHTEGDKVKFVVREVYPQDRARESSGVNIEELREVLRKANVGDQLKKVLVPNLEYGPALIEHVLLRKGFSNATKIGKTFDIDKDMDRLVEAIKEADELFKNAKNNQAKGYIIQKREDRPGNDPFYTNQEFHPMLFEQHVAAPHKEFPSFNEAIDEFFSSLESQKFEVRAVQQEREAMKKLENVRKDHTQRLEVLELTQNVDKQKADLILRNQELVDGAIVAVQTILAKQVSWDVVNDIVKSVAATGDPVFGIIKKLKLETNHMTLHLTDPYADNSDHDDDDDSADEDDDRIPAMMVDVDLGLSAFANARKYFDQKRSAAKKQQKTIESHTKALKSAEKKTKQVLKEVQVITNIIKARKTYWFEKFFWFISSENYLVIGGRDQQQNELIVKRYMKSTDVYVHADVHGASSIVIKNPTGQPVPPKTLNEAGTMAICYSVAWEAKVVTNAYWVWGNQVTKTAPTGEYLTTGSFMVRGKKNFLPPSHLVLGLGFLFRLEDGSVERHKGERKVLINEVEEDVREDDAKDEQEVEILDESDEDEDDKNPDEKRNDEEKSSDSEGDEETPKFPDTHIKIQHFSGTKINILAEVPEEPSDTKYDTEEVIYLGDDKPIVIKPTDPTPRSRGNSESKNKKPKEQVEFKEEAKQQQQVKRGQKSKLKKIKEKYKDQDEEERKLRMEILQSSGGPKTSKKSKKKSKEQAKKIILPKVPKIPANPKDPTGDDDDEEVVVQADVDMVDALTGIPSGEDELLFAVPVVAPYNTLSNYKFKMKLTPGTGRRGKAARTAVSMFLRDRAITQREKDLLKAVKDEQLARNIPGKVKLSAPKLQNVKK